MNGKFFSKGLSCLIVATLILLVFFREPKYQWLFIAVFGGWGAIMLLRILAGRIAWLGRVMKKAADKISAARQKQDDKAEKPKKRAKPPFTAGVPDDKLLLGHLSCRITDKLKAVFPDSIWQWQERQPKCIAGGGTERIRIEGAGEYTHADVTVDGYFRFSFEMMKIVSLQEAAGLPETSDVEEETPAEPPEPAQVNAADWYEWVGKETLHAVITDLNSRGYSRVFIKETGEVYVVEDGNEAVKATLKEMPGKSVWAELVGVLAAGDLRGVIDNDRLAVSWA